MTPTLPPLTDEARAVIRERLARTGRAQIDGVLAPRTRKRSTTRRRPLTTTS